MPLKCCKKGLVFLVAKTLKGSINHSRTGPLEALYSGVWGEIYCLKQSPKNETWSKNKSLKTSYLEFPIF